MDEVPNTPSFKIESLPFNKGAVRVWGERDTKHDNWPTVYAIHNSRQIYVGETTKTATRMQQHLVDASKRGLRNIRIVLDPSFNKSACRDLEFQLIQLFHGDERFDVMNGNAGHEGSDYFDRDRYQEGFDRVFAQLLTDGLFTRSVPEIVNGELFKFSPFKSLNADQATAVEGIVETLAEDMGSRARTPIVLNGDPGTGKTIVAIYLIKLITDIAAANLDDDLDIDSLFSELFDSRIQGLFRSRRIGIVIPQQSLRKTLAKVFRKTPGLSASMVVSPEQVGKSADRYDLLIVDEVHRLGQRANQASPAQNRAFSAINQKLFRDDDLEHTQLDWIVEQSDHQILLLDVAQSIKPGDLPVRVTQGIIESAQAAGRAYSLHSQMRVAGGADYIDHVFRMLHGLPAKSTKFGDYDFRFFDDVNEMRQEIVARDRESGLARMLAGYAWKWVSKKNPKLDDIVIAEFRMPWNRAQKDWVSSPTSIDEVGSIHTIQGYDLNYAGVIIGPDLRFDPERKIVTFSRADYFDRKGKENNKQRGIQYSDDDILGFVKNIYRVLLTRGIKGTYVYVCDDALREHLRNYF